jgi:hypothetical protein
MILGASFFFLPPRLGDFDMVKDGHFCKIGLGRTKSQKEARHGKSGSGSGIRGD